MARKFLITRPRYDIPTAYLYDFSESLIKSIKGCRDIHVSELKDAQANRKEFEKTIAKESPGLIFLNGHGNRKEVGGHKGETILDSGNIALTKNKIVYALACESLAELGETAIKKGTKAYIGYTAKFMVIRDTSRTSSPNKDRNALPFKHVCSTLINSLVFGSKAGEAIEKTKENYIQLIRSYGTSNDDFGDVGLIRFALAWDLEFLDMKGDPSAKFM